MQLLFSWAAFAMGICILPCHRIVGKNEAITKKSCNRIRKLMNKNKIAELLLAQLPLDVVDVVRLLVESQKCAGIARKNREEVMSRHRRGK